MTLQYPAIDHGLHPGGCLRRGQAHLEILARETADWLKFYYSLSMDEMESGFSQEFALTDRTKDDLISIVKQAKDEAFESN